MRRHIGTMALIVSLVATGSVRASVFSEDFDRYVVGSNMHGQGGWKGWNNVEAAGAPVSDLYSSSGRNSVEIAGRSDLVHEFAQSGGKWVLTAKQYIPSRTTGVSYFILLNTYRDGGPNDWSVQTEYDLEAGTITPWNAVSGSPVRIIYDQWVDLKFIIDLTANTVEEYYNGELIASGEWDDDVHGTFQCIDLYADGASAVYYDDFRLDSGSTPAGGGCFPRPAYDSGWVATPWGSPDMMYTMILRHDLGGNVDDYFVDLQRKFSGIGGPSVTNQGLGTTFSYSNLTDREIRVSAPYSAIDASTSIRVRIWVYCDDDSGSSQGQPR